MSGVNGAPGVPRHVGQALEGGCQWHEGVVATGCCVRSKDLAEEAEHRRRRPVEPAESAVEAGDGDEAAPCFADESGAVEAPGIVGREPQEDLFHELFHQCHDDRSINYLLGRLIGSMVRTIFVCLTAAVSLGTDSQV